MNTKTFAILVISALLLTAFSPAIFSDFRETSSNDGARVGSRAGAVHQLLLANTTAQNQNEIANMSDGDTAWLQTGVYTLAALFTIGRSITINGTGPTTTFVTRAGACFVVNDTKSVTFQDMNVTVSASAFGAAIDHLSTSGDINVSNCNLVGYYGVSHSGTGEVRVTSCAIYGYGNGIFKMGNGNTTVSNCNITGLHAVEGFPVGNTTVSHCDINVTGDGISRAGTGFVNVSYCNITAVNGIQNSGGPVYVLFSNVTARYGIASSAGNISAISSKVIGGSGYIIQASGLCGGVFVASSNLSVSDNYGRGVYAISGTLDIVLHNCNISTGAYPAVDHQSTGDIIIESCNISSGGQAVDRTYSPGNIRINSTVIVAANGVENSGNGYITLNNCNVTCDFVAVRHSGDTGNVNINSCNLTTTDYDAVFYIGVTGDIYVNSSIISTNAGRGIANSVGGNIYVESSSITTTTGISAYGIHRSSTYYPGDIFVNNSYLSTASSHGIYQHSLGNVTITNSAMSVGGVGTGAVYSDSICDILVDNTNFTLEVGNAVGTASTFVGNVTVTNFNISVIVGSGVKILGKSNLTMVNGGIATQTYSDINFSAIGNLSITNCNLVTQRDAIYYGGSALTNITIYNVDATYGTGYNFIKYAQAGIPQNHSNIYGLTEHILAYSGIAETYNNFSIYSHSAVSVIVENFTATVASGLTDSEGLYSSGMLVDKIWHDNTSDSQQYTYTIEDLTLAWFGITMQVINTETREIMAIDRVGETISWSGPLGNYEVQAAFDVVELAAGTTTAVCFGQDTNMTASSFLIEHPDVAWIGMYDESTSRFVYLWQGFGTDFNLTYSHSYIIATTNVSNISMSNVTANATYTAPYGSSFRGNPTRGSVAVSQYFDSPEVIWVGVQVGGHYVYFYADTAGLNMTMIDPFESVYIGASAEATIYLED